MSTVLEGPRPGSRAYIALKKLDDMGGQAGVNEWMRFCSWDITVKTFRAECIDKLMVRMKVFQRGDIYFISDDGMTHLGFSPDAPRNAPHGLVPAPMAPPNAPLESRHKVRLQVMREGAFDYMAIPSLHGSTRVEHTTSLTILGVQKG